MTGSSIIQSIPAPKDFLGQKTPLVRLRHMCTCVDLDWDLPCPPPGPHSLTPSARVPFFLPHTVASSEVVLLLQRTSVLVMCLSAVLVIIMFFFFIRPWSSLETAGSLLKKGVSSNPNLLMSTLASQINSADKIKSNCLAALWSAANSLGPGNIYHTHGFIRDPK